MLSASGIQSYIPAAVCESAPPRIWHHDRTAFTGIVGFLLQATGISNHKARNTCQGHELHIADGITGEQTTKNVSKAEVLCPFTCVRMQGQHHRQVVLLLDTHEAFQHSAQRSRCVYVIVAVQGGKDKSIWAQGHFRTDFFGRKQNFMRRKRSYMMSLVLQVPSVRPSAARLLRPSAEQQHIRAEMRSVSIRLISSNWIIGLNSL